MGLDKMVSIADKVVNPTDAEALKTAIYKLRNENLEMSAQLKDCQMKLKKTKDWNRAKKNYKESHTSGGAVVYVSLKTGFSGIFYCPACFSKESNVPLQTVPLNNATKFKLSPRYIDIHKFCPSCEQLYLFNKKPSNYEKITSNRPPGLSRR